MPAEETLQSALIALARLDDDDFAQVMSYLPADRRADVVTRLDEQRQSPPAAENTYVGGISPWLMALAENPVPDELKTDAPTSYARTALRRAIASVRESADPAPTALIDRMAARLARLW